MKDKIQIHKVYEYHLNNLHTYPQYQQMIIGQNLAELEYINDLLDRNSKDVGNGLIRRMANEIIMHTIPADVLSLSAFVFKGKERGLNVEPLIDAMNREGDWLIKETLKDNNKNTMLMSRGIGKC